jgi:hypothetical protein
MFELRRQLDRVWKWTAALAVSLGLASCDRSPSGGTASAAGRKPQVTVSAVDGFEITHAFHRDVDFDSFLKTIPTGSVDLVDTTDAQPYVIVVVEARWLSDRAEAQSGAAPRVFRTIFRGMGAAESAREWKPVEGNHSGKSTAIFVLPASMEEAETRLSDPGPQ